MSGSRGESRARGRLPVRWSQGARRDSEGPYPPTERAAEPVSHGHNRCYGRASPSVENPCKLVSSRVRVRDLVASDALVLRADPAAPQRRSPPVPKARRTSFAISNSTLVPAAIAAPPGRGDAYNPAVRRGTGGSRKSRASPPAGTPPAVARQESTTSKRPSLQTFRSRDSHAVDIRRVAWL